MTDLQGEGLDVVPVSRERRVVQVLIVALPILLLVVMAWSRRWVAEDAFLNFRVADQIKAGNGPVFNVGQRVEVATSPLWLWMLVVGRSIFAFAKIEYVAIVTSLTLTVLGLVLVALGAAKLWRRDRRPASLYVPFGMLVICAVPVWWDWATSGLEVGLSVAWIGGLMLVVATVTRSDAATRRRPVELSPWRSFGVGVVLGLGPLIRPDLAVLSGVALVACLWARRSRGRELAYLLAGFFTLPVAYEVFRAGYYGTLVPNTALAKDAGGTYWSQGWNYLVDLVSPYWLLVPIAAVARAGVYLASRRAGPPCAAALALPLGGLLHGLLVVRSGGDYMHGRLLLPSMFAIVAPVAVVPWSRRLTIPVTVMTLWALLAAVTLRVHSTPVSPVYPSLLLTEHGTTDTRSLMERSAKPGHRPVLATDFKATDGLIARRLQDAGSRALVLNTKVFLHVTPHRTVLASPSSGISGYLAGPDVIVHEFYGLADPVGSRQTPTRTSLPGHRKFEDEPWIFALETKPGFSGQAAPQEVSAARQALRCGSLAELLAATDAPLTVDRFWSNLTGAVGRTRLVVPRDPRDARRKFCG